MNIQIMYNDNSRIQARILKNKLLSNGFNLVDNLADLVIIIGGDGTFLKSIRKLNYSSFPLYIGVNCGNLGYLQDISCAQIDKIITFLKENENNISNDKISKFSIAKISYLYRDKIITDNAINELQVVGKKYRKIEFELNDTIEFKEKVLSSGIVFATPLGSTAYNKSLGGPILCEGIDAICATLFAPIQNNRTKDYITNSLVGKKFGIKILSNLDDIEIFIDGQQVDIDLKNLNEINIEIDTKKLYKLNVYKKTYSRNMFEKMIK